MKKLLNENLNRQTLFLAVLTLLLVFLITLRSPADTDMWWHLSSGRAMLERGEILTEDIFSFTRFGQSWTNAFWLPDLGLYLLWKIGGAFLVTVSVALLAVVTLAVVFWQAKSPLPVRVGIVILATLALAPVWTPRPQLVSIFLLTLLDSFLSRDGESLQKPFWLLLPLFIFWANSHGGFIIGFLLLGAFLAGKLLEPALLTVSDWRGHWSQIGRAAVFTTLGVFAVGLNPNGLAIWKLPFYTVDVALTVQEWNSPDFHRLDLHPILWLLFLLIIALGFSTRRISLFDLFKTLGFAYLAFYAQRNMALFAVIAAPVAARYLAVAWDDLKSAPIGLWLARLRDGKASQPLPGRLTKVINLSLVGLIFAIALVRAYTLSLPILVYQDYPKAAVDWIERNHPPGRMLNSYNWGGFLIWELDDYPVFIDGRTDLYGDEIIDQWWQIIRATEDGLDLLDEWGINFVILEPDWPVVSALQALGWPVLYRDDLSVILGRQEFLSTLPPNP